MNETMIDKFNDKIERTENCWIWKGAISANGYGSMRWQGKNRAAHRISFMIANPEKMIDGLSIDHLCRNRKCVNPKHLEAVTQRENILRGLRKTEQSHCKNGHALSGDNLKPNKRNARQCRTCANEANARYAMRLRQKMAME